MLDPFFPQTLNRTEHYDDCAVTLLGQFERSHCIERTVSVDGSRQLTIVQTKSWPKKYVLQSFHFNA